ncbi:DUF3887 domain-containing protein [bacterium D16-51]|nr:DUF3887 domain-containing protein [bacterium D16-59]RKI60941.1 DUF3887 domain-containing protein [bacterium D16-51]
MTAEKYAASVAKRVKCSRAKRQEIRQQLLSDFTAAKEQGSTEEEIISQMGDITELAKEFNDTLPKSEHQKYLRDKIIRIAIPVVSVFLVLAFFLYQMIPRTADIEDSRIFQKAKVEAKMKETIKLFNDGDSDALCADTIPQMLPYLSDKAIKKTKAQFTDDWGECLSFGTAYITELIQMRKHLAVGEITVTYENISVTYRLTYDRDMKLAGIYIR